MVSRRENGKIGFEAKKKMGFDAEKKWASEMGFYFSSIIKCYFFLHSQSYVFKCAVKLELFSNLQHFKK